MHTGHLLVDGKKMSKSAGNFYRLHDLEARYPLKKALLYRAFRMMCLQNRYRENFNFTFERLESAMATVTNLDNILKRLKSYTPKNTKVRREFRDMLQASMQKFVTALENDIDTVIALTEVFEITGIINRDIDDDSLATKEVASFIEILKSWDMVMGVIDWGLMDDVATTDEVMELVLQRQAAKEEKNFALADELRKKVDEL